MRARPFDFRFSGRDSNFWRSHKVPLVKPTLADNTGPKWRFNPGLLSCLHSESKTAKSSSHSFDIERCIIRKPRDSLRPLAFPPSRILLSSEPVDVCWKLFHICTRATPSTIGPQNIYFLGPRFVRPSGRSERGPLNLVKRRQWTGRDARFWLRS